MQACLTAVADANTKCDATGAAAKFVDSNECGYRFCSDCGETQFCCTCDPDSHWRADDQPLCNKRRTSQWESRCTPTPDFYAGRVSCKKGNYKKHSLASENPPGTFPGEEGKSRGTLVPRNGHDNDHVRG